MTAPHLRRAGIAALVAGGIAVAVSQSAGSAPYAPHPAITAQGVGPIKLGMPATTLQKRGYVGKLKTGCELAGPQSKAADVKIFNGTVGFTMNKARKANNIAVNGEGPQARGVEVGDTLADIQKAFKTVKVDKSQEGTFGGDFVTIPKSAGGRIGFFIDLSTNTITTIGVPYVPVCE
jgi:hypothetical protein